MGELSAQIPSPMPMQQQILPHVMAWRCWSVLRLTILDDVRQSLMSVKAGSQAGLQKSKRVQRRLADG